MRRCKSLKNTTDDSKVVNLKHRRIFIYSKLGELNSQRLLCNQRSLLLLPITQKADLRDFHIRFIFQKQKLHTFLYVQFMTATSRIGSVSLSFFATEQQAYLK